MGYEIDGVWFPAFIYNDAMSGDKERIEKALLEAYKLGGAGSVGKRFSELMKISFTEKSFPDV